jgi:DNA-binding MarR family transcriptional regulator
MRNILRQHHTFNSRAMLERRRTIEQWAWGKTVPSAISRLVLLALAQLADTNGTVLVALADLANEVQLSERTIRTMIKDLEACGAIEVMRRPGYQSIIVLACPRARP